MTKHRRREEWIETILASAEDEIGENGYSGFSMELLARRTGFSKGGIYRFFGNRQDVGLAVFSRAYRRVLDFDVDEVVSWDLSLDESIVRVIGRYNMSEREARKLDRVWIRLLPEVLGDTRFQQTRQQLLREIEQKMIVLASRIAHRDGRGVPENFENRAHFAFSMATGLLEGFAVQSALGESISVQASLVQVFVSDVIRRYVGAGEDAPVRDDKNTV